MNPMKPKNGVTGGRGARRGRGRRGRRSAGNDPDYRCSYNEPTIYVRQMRMCSMFPFR